MLVQAKVLDDEDEEYSHIDRKIGNTGVRQIDRLIQTARDRGIAAIYAFYNNLSDTSRVPIRTCSCFSCFGCWGCSMAIAPVVRNLLPDKSYDTLSAISRPWTCMLCPKSISTPRPYSASA